MLLQENGIFKFIDLEFGSVHCKNKKYNDPDILIARALIHFLKVHRLSLWNIKRKYLIKNIFTLLIQLYSLNLLESNKENLFSF